MQQLRCLLCWSGIGCRPRAEVKTAGLVMFFFFFLGGGGEVFAGDALSVIVFFFGGGEVVIFSKWLCSKVLSLEVILDVLFGGG